MNEYIMTTKSNTSLLEKHAHEFNIEETKLKSIRVSFDMIVTYLCNKQITIVLPIISLTS